MTGLGSLADVVGIPVRVRDVRVGEVSGVYLDSHSHTAIGLEVASFGGARRFLPWVAARVERGAIRLSSALLLVDAGDSYERRGAVALHDRDALVDLRVSADGRVWKEDSTTSTLRPSASVGR